jgi:holo-ACP synthase
MNEYFTGREQSLNDILEARDRRVEYQEQLINRYHSTMVSYKLNIPGPVKYNSLIKRIFDEGLSVFKHNLEQASIKTIDETAWYKDSGPEYFAVFYLEASEIKRITSQIEEIHALGRLYDFDVLDSQGRQVSRQELGIGIRKCLLCESSAFECGRSRRHEISELINYIEIMAKNYFNTKDDVVIH